MKTVAAFVDLQDDGAYDVRCVYGHRIRAVVQNSRFELLMDSAVLALKDEYYREAVLSFAAALEAFWGFYIRVVARHSDAPLEEIPHLSKDLRMSERRAGAMYLAHLLLVHRRYERYPEARSNFRNKVVHEGVFPSREEAMDYGTCVYDAVVDGIGQLKSNAREAADREIAIALAPAHSKLRDPSSKWSAATHWVKTFLPFEDEASPRSFDEAFRQWSELNVWDITSTLAREKRTVEDQD